MALHRPAEDAVADLAELAAWLTMLVDSVL
jgi:hypothetical protein